jgi:hypothetical protein
VVPEAARASPLWPTRRELISEVFEFVEGFYNTTRRHSRLGYLSPAQLENISLTNTSKEIGETRKPRSVPTTGPTPIAGDLLVSVNTVKAHIKHLYAKLDTHHRNDAVERARALGLLAPSPGGRR